MTDLGDHVFFVRVYYEDTDAGGVVYHSNYLRFAERARTEFLREAGIDHITQMAENGLMFAVRRCEAEYVKPAQLDDALEIRTRCLEATGASFLARTIGSACWRNTSGDEAAARLPKGRRPSSAVAQQSESDAQYRHRINDITTGYQRI